VGSNSTKKKSTLNYSIWYRVSILFLISITVVCSSLYVLPLAFSSNGTFITYWRGSDRVEEQLRYPKGIAVDSSSGNVYVADTGNNIISAFTSRPPIIINVAFSSEEGERYMVMAQGGLHKDHAFQAVAKLQQRQDDIRKL